MDTDTENEIVTVIDGDSDRPPGGMVWGSFYETVASIKDSLKVTHDIANGLKASITFTESIKALLLISEADSKLRRNWRVVSLTARQARAYRLLLP
jgi:hypothetical protein